MFPAHCPLHYLSCTYYLSTFIIFTRQSSFTIHSCLSTHFCLSFMFLHSFYLNLRSSTTCINFLFLGQFSLPFSVHFLCSFLHIFLSPFVSNQPILRLCSLVSFQSFCRVKFPSLYLLISVCLSLTAFYYPLRVLTLFLFHCIRFTYNTFVPFIPITFCLYFSISLFLIAFISSSYSFVRSFVCRFIPLLLCVHYFCSDDCIT